MNEISRVRKALTDTLAPLGQVSVFPGETLYAKGHGFHKRHFVIRVLAHSETQLDELLADEGDRSVKATLERDVTLGDVVQHLTVLKSTGYRQYTAPAPAGQALGAEWTIETMTDQRS